MDYIKEAKKLGFSNAAIMDTQKLVFKPEYRKFCEENQCELVDQHWLSEQIFEVCLKKIN